jgi:hypothetical protein
MTLKEAKATDQQYRKNLKDTGVDKKTQDAYPKGGGPNNPLGVNQYGSGSGGGGSKGGGKKAAAKKKATSGTGAKSAASKKLSKMTPAQILALGRKQEAARRHRADVIAAAKKRADAKLAAQVAAGEAKLAKYQGAHQFDNVSVGKKAPIRNVTR